MEQLLFIMLVVEAVEVDILVGVVALLRLEDKVVAEQVELR